jgi:UDP-glucose 4-epimerase
MSKILVTGGAGFVGTNLIIKLLNESHKVVSLDNYAIGSRKNHQIGAEYIEGDVNNIENLINNDFDYCFHLAGLSRIQPSFDNPKLTFKYNTETVLSVLEWSRANNTKVIYSGSSSKHHNPHLSPYALFKFLGEEICKTYRRNYNMDIEIVRFYNVYGPFEIKHGKWPAVIGLWRGLAESGKKITIVGDGEQRRDFTHVDDIVDGLIKIAFSKHSEEDAWELGSGKNYSLNEVYTFFQKKFNVDKIYINDQNGNYRKTLREKDNALEKLNWKPEDKLERYILNL